MSPLNSHCRYTACMYIIECELLDFLFDCIERPNKFGFASWYRIFHGDSEEDELEDDEEQELQDDKEDELQARFKSNSSSSIT